jgi:hypothetical protein
LDFQGQIRTTFESQSEAKGMDLPNMSSPEQADAVEEGVLRMVEDDDADARPLQFIDEDGEEVLLSTAEGATSPKHTHIREDGQEVQFGGGGTVFIGDLLMEETTIELRLSNIGDATSSNSAAVGVCVSDYNRKNGPYCKGAWGVFSRGHLSADGKNIYTHHTPFDREGAKLTVRYVPARGAGWLEWWIDGQKQKIVAGIDVEGRGVRLCIGGSFGVTWTILQ